MFPAATQMLKEQKTTPVPKHHSAPEAKMCPGMLEAPALGESSHLVGIPPFSTCRRTVPSRFPGPLRAPQPQPLPSAPPSCRLPRAPRAAVLAGFQRVRVGDSVALVQPHLLFAASPSPAFSRLQVTASQALKELCSHFPRLTPSC